MAAEEMRLSGALQENILTLLCFDDANCKMARAALTPHLFESSVYKEIAGHAIDFIDQFGEAIKEHLPDHLEKILLGDDARKASSYKRVLDNLFNSKDSINSTYIIKSLHKFVRQQNLKAGVVRAVEAMDDGRIDEAEVELHKALSARAVSFDAGLSLSKPEDVVKAVEHTEEEGFTLGIPGLDDEGIYPRRREQFVLMAARGKGKSWFLTHCAKRALMQRWKVVIITLELTDSSYMGRMLQALFSISRRKAEVTVTRIEGTREGGLADLVQEKLERPTMKDDDIKEWLTAKAKKDLKRRPPIYIKEFPTGALTIAELDAYLDGLERFENFIPDAILVDYPDLMSMDAKNLRIELGRTFAMLRGVCAKRNAANIVVTQGNRDSEDATLVTGAMAAEDISKLAHADNFLTMSQTPAEYSMGVARLYVEKARNEAGKFQVLITQALAIGQFCLDSMRLKVTGNYFEMMKSKAPTPEGKERERRGGEERRRGERRRSEDDDEPRPRRRARSE